MIEVKTLIAMPAYSARMGVFMHNDDKSNIWLHAAISSLEQEAARSADTHLLKLDLAGFPGIDFYFKDESSHPTGSLKHRLARSLFLYALCNGILRVGQSVIDASSGKPSAGPPSGAGAAAVSSEAFTGKYAAEPGWPLRTARRPIRTAPPGWT